MPGIYDVICVKNRLKWEKVSAMIPVNVDNVASRLVIDLHTSKIEITNFAINR